MKVCPNRLSQKTSISNKYHQHVQNAAILTVSDGPSSSAIVPLSGHAPLLPTSQLSQGPASSNTTVNCPSTQMSNSSRRANDNATNHYASTNALIHNEANDADSVTLEAAAQVNVPSQRKRKKNTDTLDDTEKTFLKRELAAVQARIVQQDAEIDDKNKRILLLKTRAKDLEDRENDRIYDKYFPEQPSKRATYCNSINSQQPREHCMATPHVEKNNFLCCCRNQESRDSQANDHYSQIIEELKSFNTNVSSLLNQSYPQINQISRLLENLIGQNILKQVNPSASEDIEVPQSDASFASVESLAPEDTNNIDDLN